MDRIRQVIDQHWKGPARKYFWGDPLDVRYYLCAEIAKLHNKRVLDAGCNVGVTTACLDASNEVVGIDLNEEAIAIAGGIAPSARFIVGDLFDASLRPGPFDAVVLANVLPRHDFASEHVPEELIASMHAALVPGGTLFLTTPNGGNPYYRGKGKIDIAGLERLLGGGGWDLRIYGWNPFPIRAGHVLRHVPGILAFLAWLMRQDIGTRRAVALYAVATRK